jgi:hypothetical protein
MYKSFEVTNFRCFRSLKIENISRINLIAGANNVGKTALLEALFIHSGAYNPELTLRVDVFRGIEKKKIEFGPMFQPPWNYIFNEFDITKTIEFIGRYKKMWKRSLKLRVINDASELTKIYRYAMHAPMKESDVTGEDNLPSGAHVLELNCIGEEERSVKYYYIFDRGGTRVFPIPPTLPYQVVFMPARTKFIGEDVDRFGKLQTDKKEDLILRALRVIEPKLKSLTVVIENDLPLIQGDVGKSRLVPLPLMGEGMSRLASLTLAIAYAENGVALIDEVENGFHHSILYKVWQTIGEAARLFNTQVFTTTHSLECIIAAHKAFERSKLYDFRLHRLESKGNTTRVVTYDRGALSATLESGFEVR